MNFQLKIQELCNHDLAISNQDGNLDNQKNINAKKIINELLNSQQ